MNTTRTAGIRDRGGEGTESGKDPRWDIEGLGAGSWADTGIP